MIKSQHKVKRIAEIYRTFRNLGRPGEEFAILHAPARVKNVPLLFIGEQPGAAHTHVDGSAEQAMQSWPATNQLRHDVHRYCMFAQWLFWRAQLLPQLERAQSTDWMFFRRTTKLSMKRRKELISKSNDAVDELIEAINPRRIIFVGLTAARTARRRAGLRPLRCAYLDTFMYSNRPSMCLPHFSLRNVDYEQVEAAIPALQTFLRNYQLRQTRDE